MQIIKVSTSPLTTTSGKAITFVFQIIDDGLKDSSNASILDSSGVNINYGVILTS